MLNQWIVHWTHPILVCRRWGLVPSLSSSSVGCPHLPGVSPQWWKQHYQYILLAIAHSIIFPRHQIWHLLYNLVTPIEAHGCITKHHTFNQKKAQLESSVLQDCSDIKIMYMSHNKIFISLESTPNTSCCARCFFTKNAWLCRSAN